MTKPMELLFGVVSRVCTINRVLDGFACTLASLINTVNIVRDGYGYQGLFKGSDAACSVKVLWAILSL